MRLIICIYEIVLVDSSVGELKQSLDYRVLVRCRVVMRMGKAVMVPFGPKTVTGFVIRHADETEVEKKKTSEINKIINTDTFFDENLLELFQSMAVYYKAKLINIIKTAVPAG